MLQGWKVNSINDIMDDYSNPQQQLPNNMFSNMKALKPNSGMNDLASNFNVWGNNGEGANFLGEGSGGGLGWIGIGQNALKGVQDAVNANEDEQIAGGIGNGIQGFFGSNKYDNDIAQAIAGAGNGAKMGFGVGGPWGAAIGGVLGLGSSFLDDL